MPEGPEIYLSSLFINNVCKGRIFGSIFKSDKSKCPEVITPFKTYTIAAFSRGKELKITLLEHVNDKAGKCLPQSLDILITFGLTGNFDWLDANGLEKHSHLSFFTCDDGPKKALSFVDYRRFGKWVPGADFSFTGRGPCTLLEYNDFRKHVLSNLSNSAFNKPICEALLNQKFFNGIGNYLRAEVLHRAKVPPFACARNVLESLPEDNAVKSEQPDLLQLCSVLQHEVVQLEGSWYDGSDRDDATNAFNSWLQCYYKEGMKNTVDHNKRTIWYSGPLGPMAPKGGQVRARKVSKKKKGQDAEHVENLEEEKAAPNKVDKADGDEVLVISDDDAKSHSKRPKRKRAKEQVKVKTEVQNISNRKITRLQRQEVLKAVESSSDATEKPKLKTRKSIVKKKEDSKNETPSKKDRSRKRNGTSASTLRGEENEGVLQYDIEQPVPPLNALISDDKSQSQGAEEDPSKNKKTQPKSQKARSQRPLVTNDSLIQPSSAKKMRLSRSALQRSRSKSGWKLPRS